MKDPRRKNSNVTVLCYLVFAILLGSFFVDSSVFAQGRPPGPPGPPPPGPPQPPTSLPEAPIPDENPITEEKAMLGKILFWEEQLSSDNSVACGTCHISNAGGSDPRSFESHSVHPGPDALGGTPDDIRGSIGVIRKTSDNSVSQADETFYPERQVTGRRAMNSIGAAHSLRLFWDGRAQGPFEDPLTGEVLIPQGGALEIQALGPILSDVEMAKEGRTWQEVTDKLQSVRPLALVVDMPLAMQQALEGDTTYPSLFEKAFGTPDITPSRIAMAIATYERTLNPDQTPFDRFAEGDTTALTPRQQQGFELFRTAGRCGICHGGPDFSDHNFHNTGVRPFTEDLGRFEVTGNMADRGRFKTPSLRNTKLRAPYFHNGGAEDLQDVLEFYRRGGDFAANRDPAMRPLNLSNNQLSMIQEFIEVGLTDPRVEQSLPPFDHPTLRPYFRRGDVNWDGIFDLSDPVAALEHLFLTSALLPCEDSTDANDDGTIDISDPVSMLYRLFKEAAPLPLPGDNSTGPDPTEDELDCQPN